MALGRAPIELSPFDLRYNFGFVAYRLHKITNAVLSRVTKIRRAQKNPKLISTRKKCRFVITPLIPSPSVAQPKPNDGGTRRPEDTGEERRPSQTFPGWVIRPKNSRSIIFVPGHRFTHHRINPQATGKITKAKTGIQAKF